MSFKRLASALIYTAITSRAVAQDIGSLFKSQLSPAAQIYYPGSDDWSTTLQQRWSNWSAPTYRAAIKIATAQDVQTVVQIAGENNIPFLATAGGHGASRTFSALTNGIDIDITALNQTQYDPLTGLLTVGGAVTNAQLWDTLQPLGRQMPTAAAPCVGAMGATLGAGVGTLSGIWGYTIDVLQSVRIVTADGCLVNASAIENPDLFWAIRGAGANFGIVTEATFVTYPAIYGGQVSEADLAFPASANASIWQALQSFDNSIDPGFSLSIVSSYDRSTNQVVMIVNGVFYGSNATMVQYLKPFLDLGPVATQFTTGPWNELSSHLYFGQDGTSCEKNLYLNSAGDGARKTTPGDYVQFLSDFAVFSEANPLVNASFVVFKYSTAGTQARSVDATAYPYRDMSTYLLFENIYPNSPGMDQKVDDFVSQARTTFQPGSGYDNLTLYHNYAHGDEGPEVWYSAAHLPRLAQLKNQWDPHSRFSIYNPVPQSYP